MELEHLNKIRSKVSSSSVSASPNSNGNNVASEVKGKKENALVAEIAKLSAKVNELSTVRSEIQDMKKQLANVVGSEHSGYGEEGYRGRRKSRSKCKNCLQRNYRFCNHCVLCGASDHWKRDCVVQKNE